MKKSKLNKKTAPKKSIKKPNGKVRAVKNKKPVQNKKSVPASLGKTLIKGFEKVAETVENLFSNRPKDLVAAIKMDHEALRNYLSLLKDTDANLEERRRAYDQFAILLKSHTIAEEAIVYKSAEQLTGREMQLKVTEGYVEHRLAEDLMKRIEATTEPMDWSAHANVLSEIVEHHLKEEDRDLLPLIRKEILPQMDMDALVKYLGLRAETQTKVSKKNAGVLETLK